MSNITCTSQSHLEKIEMILKGNQCGGETAAKRENSHLTGHFVLRSVSVVSSQAAVTAAACVASNDSPAVLRIFIECSKYFSCFNILIGSNSPHRPAPLCSGSHND